MREVLRTMWILTGGIVVKKRIGELEKRIDNGLVDIYVCIGQKIFST